MRPPAATGVATRSGAVNGPRFTSVFAPDLERFLAFKENMGFYGKSRVWYLKSFDHYCAEHGLENFDRPTVEGWVASKQSRQQNTCRSWISYIRDFGRWERINGNDNAYELSDELKAGFIRSQPYLLTNEEVSKFFRAAARLETISPWKWQAVAFFALMHSCGLRPARRVTCRRAM
jgi:integrase